MKVLVTGFEPFLDEKENPTSQIVDWLNSCAAHRNPWQNLDVRGLRLPVLFDRAFERLEKERQHFRPDVIISFGLAGGRDSFDIEMLALNFRGGDQTSRGDNSGFSPSGEIVSEAPLALPSTLPVHQILQELVASKIPAKTSSNAGAYVCNDLFFQMQNELRFTRIQSGFIHVPRISGDWPWRRFEDAVAAVLRVFDR